MGAGARPALKLTVLGSGNADPQPERASAGYLVQLDAPVMLDIGTGTFRNLRRHADISAILISHLHVDHYADLLPYLFSQNKRESPLAIFGPPETAAAVEHLRLSCPSLRELSFELRVTEVRGAFDVAGARVVPFEVEHSKRLTALAYRIEYAGRVLAYSGDSTACPALEAACRGADLAILEATSPEPLPTHMTAEEAAALAARAGVGRLVLSHLGPAWEGRSDPRFAFDGLRL